MVGGAPPSTADPHPSMPGPEAGPPQQTFVTELAQHRNMQALLENELAEKASENEQTSPQRILMVLQRHLFVIIFLTFVLPISVFVVDSYVRKKSYLVELGAQVYLEEEEAGFTFGFSRINAPSVNFEDLGSVLNAKDFDLTVLRRIALASRLQVSKPIATPESRAGGDAAVDETKALLIRLAQQGAEENRVPMEYKRLRGRQSFRSLDEGRVAISLSGPHREAMTLVAEHLVPAVNEVFAERQREAVENFRARISELLTMMNRENENIETELIRLAAENEVEDTPLGKTFSRLNELKQDEHKLRMKLLKGELQLGFLKRNRSDRRMAERFFIRSTDEIRLTLASTVPLRKTWADLVADHEEMLAKYTPEHPKVRAVQDEIDSVKARLRSGGHVTAEGKLPPLPTVEETTALTKILKLSEELGLLKLELNEVSAQVAEHQAKQAGMSKKMDPAERQRMAELMRRRRALLKQSSALEGDQMKLHQALYHTQLQNMDLSGLAPYTQSGPAGSRLVSPLIHVDVALALILGLVMGCAIAFLLESMDQYIHTSFDIYQRLRLPCLGIIPYIRDREDVQISADNPGSRIAEIYAHLRNNIRYGVVQNPQQCLLIASALQHEGKSTVAMNLSVSYALEENSVLLIDADLRRGRHGNNEIVELGEELEESGLSDYLVGDATFREVIKATHVEGLDVMPSGRRIHNPARFVGSERMKMLLEDAKANYDIVIVDSPAILPVVDTTTYSNVVSGVLLVVAAEEVNVERVRSALHRLYHVNSPVIGAVLNKARTNQCASYYGSYSSGAPYYYTD
jgi:capsular exopolysaccharide synthesis family protein